MSVWFFSQQPFLHLTVHINMWKLYNLKLPTLTHPHCGVDGNGTHWRLGESGLDSPQKEKHPPLNWLRALENKRPCVNRMRHIRLTTVFQNPAMCQALCNYERHRNSGTAGLHKATHISRVRLNGNSSQIVSISVFILFPLHHSNFQEMLNI